MHERKIESFDITPARVKFNETCMQRRKNKHIEKQRKIMQHHFSKASLYKLLKEPASKSKMISYLMMDRAGARKPPPLIKDKYPHLADQLNDLNPKVPAYRHFESLAVLRDDLREAKNTHFQKNYSKELIKKRDGFLEERYFGEPVKQPDYLAKLR